MNTSPTTVEEKEILSVHLVTPPVRAINIHLNEPRKDSSEIPIVLTARNKEGVTIKDALAAIYKHYRKKVSRCVIVPLLLERTFSNWTRTNRKIMSSTKNHTLRVSSGPPTEPIFRPKRARRRERRSGNACTCGGPHKALLSSPLVARRRTRKVGSNFPIKRRDYLRIRAPHVLSSCGSVLEALCTITPLCITIVMAASSP